MTAPRRTDWVPCRSYGNELEAHIAVAVLDAAGIPAVIHGNDTAGLFGAGFQGMSARGVVLLVPRAALAAAQSVLARPRPPLEEGVLPDELSDAPDDPPARTPPHGLRWRDERRDPA